MNLLKRSKDPKIAWLSEQPWWQDLSPSELTELAATGDRVSLRAGHELMREGSIAYEAAIIVSGSVEVRHGDELVATLGPGEVVGELAMLDRSARRSADVVTAEPTELLVFGIEAFERVIDTVDPVRAQVRAAAAEHGG